MKLTLLTALLCLLAVNAVPLNLVRDDLHEQLTTVGATCNTDDDCDEDDDDDDGKFEYCDNEPDENGSEPTFTCLETQGEDSTGDGTDGTTVGLLSILTSSAKSNAKSNARSKARSKAKADPTIAEGAMACAMGQEAYKCRIFQPSPQWIPPPPGTPPQIAAFDIPENGGQPGGPRIRDGKQDKKNSANHCNKAPAIIEYIETTVNKDLDNVQLPISQSWCMGVPVTGAANTFDVTYNGATVQIGNADFWTNQFTPGDMDLHAYGIFAEATPIGFGASPGFVINAPGVPSPTACRSGLQPEPAKLDDTKANDVANTVQVVFKELDTSGALPAPKVATPGGPQMLRHGLLGYVKNHLRVATQTTNLKIHMGNRPTISLDLMTGDVSKRLKGEKPYVDRQRSTWATVDPKVANFNFGVNGGGFKKTYYKGNYHAFRKLVSLIAEELDLLKNTDPNMTPPAQGELPASCTGESRLKKLEFGQRGTTPVAFAATWATVVTNLRAFSGDHARRACQCVLDQAKNFFDKTWPTTAMATSAPLLDVDGNAGPAGSHLLGTSVGDKRANAIRGIKLTTHLIYSKGQEAQRASDLTRIIGISSFMGFDLWVNCKSGQDRTGIVAAANTAFAMMVASMQSASGGTLPSACLDNMMYLANFYQEIAVDTTAVNTAAGIAATAALPIATDCAVVGGVKLGAPVDSDNYVDGTKTPLATWGAAKGYQLMGMYRNLVLRVVIRQSWPITIGSTGMGGLKWEPSKTLVSEFKLPAFYLPGKVQELLPAIEADIKNLWSGKFFVLTAASKFRKS